MSVSLSRKNFAKDSTSIFSAISSLVPVRMVVIISCIVLWMYASCSSVGSSGSLEMKRRPFTVK